MTHVTSSKRVKLRDPPTKGLNGKVTATESPGNSVVSFNFCS